MKCFSFTTAAFCDEDLVDMPGFSHRSQPFKRTCTWYPFEEWRVRVWLFAKNRSTAGKQLLRVGRNDVRDLDDGVKRPVPECIAAKAQGGGK